MRTPLLTIALAATALSLAACSTEGEMRAVDPAGGGEPSTATTPAGEAPAPVPDGEVSTHGLVTVLDPGTGPELCLGAVAESYPPQCGGPKIEGFDWGDVGVEKAAGVTWGSYAVTGTFDGTTFTATEAIPAALYDALNEDPDDPLAAACDDPETTDEGKTSQEDMDATLTAASALPGYASAWLSGETVNVAVTGDAEAAETQLRATWGGPLCVTTVERTEADLNEINQELQAALPTLLTSGSYTPDTLDAEVMYDDGSIQEWVDATYGEGLVRVTSALTPVS